MSLISELKEVLARRRKILDIFGTYKEMYWDLLDLLATTYGTDIGTAVSAFYLANYVMDSTQDGISRDKIIDDDTRVKLVLENLIEARRRLPLDFESLVKLYALIYDWAERIEKDLVQYARLLVKKKVIITNLVDIYAVPLFSFLEQTVPQLDLRWAMAELSGGLNRQFAYPIFENILKNYPVSVMKPEYYFDAGFYVIYRFVEEYFQQKLQDKDHLQQLEAFGDIGRKAYEFGCSVFYNVESKDLFLDIAYDDQIVPNTDLDKELKKGTSLLQPDNTYNLLFAKFYVNIKISGERPIEKIFYIHNYEESEQTNLYPEVLGSMNYFLVTSQDLNLKSIDTYAIQRCIDIRGIERRLDQGERSKDYIQSLLSAWIEVYLHNLQEEYNFLETPDELRVQSFIPVGLLKQLKNQDSVQMLLDTVKSITAKRMKNLGIKSSSLTMEQTLWIINYLKNITDHGANIVRMILLQQDPTIEMSIYPLEFLLTHSQLAQRNILIMFSTDDSNLVGIICQNEAALEFQAKALKRRHILSKIQQILTNIRIKSLSDARAAKLDAYIQRNVEKTFQAGKLWLKGSVSDFPAINQDQQGFQVE
ncbi:hypothetical protein CEE45_02070 [Candidatus Heimdallarchaeota archaeon B3_Heim]|nr:MAG: hypothetical protein CEE45_02070 [Candidatus Heimdallarchaeota archaeon B3_Heim]